MKSTVSIKPTDVNKKWILIDAQDAVLGRLASFVALRLRGKHRAFYTPHVDCGDNVIIINAEKVGITGKKADAYDDRFFWHTGYPGGIKSRTKGEILAGAYPERVVENAIRRMLPKDSALARTQLTNLRVYKGAAHPHEAQQPEVIDFKELNRKNKLITE
jgi:large subunit ribosomal protein L13